MEKKPFFITTAIDYPSAKVHIGHAFEKIQADVIARYKRLQGFDVHFSVGTDEHGLKIQRYAQKAGKSPQNFVDEMSGYFKELWSELSISNDDFIRTTESRHIKVVKEIIEKIYEKGDIYKGKYRGLYCVDCETYYLPKDLENGNCPIHQKPAETIEEETYFFKMSGYQKQLVEYIQKNKDFIIPESRKNEILSRLKEPLQDLSITRKAVEWGIPFPIDEKLTIFVWVEALINYFTTIDYPNDKFKKFWPADIHIIGKDILWHHSVIWGSLLMSLELPLPKTIFVHGYVTSGGQKMSKSLGNVVDPFELIETYTQKIGSKEAAIDAVRYFLLREISPTQDGDFTTEKFENRYNSDLAKGLGNLTSRIIALALRTGPEVPISRLGHKGQEFLGEIKKQYKENLDNLEFGKALENVWQLISFCDKYIDRKKPWEREESDHVISNLLILLAEIAGMLIPFLPGTSKLIFKQLGIKDFSKEHSMIIIEKGEPLFPRL
ncbi:MAG: methionine--tRNA ligase [Candidatus Pacebacteria bacterium]|nr:methionine--tRNA ligase [Candidatus Paceibacterota bacterium]